MTDRAAHPPQFPLPGRDWLARRTGLLPGTVYTTLRGLENRGLVEGHWEEAEVAEAERRPRRRYYTLTPKGDAAHALARARLGDLVTGLGVENPATTGAAE